MMGATIRPAAYRLGLLSVRRWSWPYSHNMGSADLHVSGTADPPFYLPDWADKSGSVPHVFGRRAELPHISNTG